VGGLRGGESSASLNQGATEARHLGVALRDRLDDGLPLIDADEVQIEQVILNLIRNACEAVVAASPAQPVVTVSTTM
jgi:nitrogen-specific signal transduction histidine kinase